MGRKKKKKKKKGFFDGALGGFGSSKSEFSKKKDGTYGYGGYYGGYGGYDGWDDWYDGGDWKDWRTPGQSASSFWTTSSWGSMDEEWKYKEILYNIANAANVPANSIGSGERNLRVKWATNPTDDENHEDDDRRDRRDGRVEGGPGREHDKDNSNKLSKDTIILSPDVIDNRTSRKSEWTDEEKQDVLIADSLTLAAMKATAHQQSEKDVFGETDQHVKMIADPLWTSQETLIAEKAVLEKYPGFKSYYAAYRDYWSDPNAREQLEMMIQEANKAGVNWIDGAVAAARYEMLYPDQKLDLPKAYREAVEAAKKTMPMDADAQYRGKNALDAAKQILKILPQNEEKKKPDAESGPDGEKQENQPGEGDGDGEGDGKGNGKDDENAPPKFGFGRDKMDEQEKNTNLKPERDDDGKMVSKSDREGVPLGETIERQILDEDEWRGGTDHVMVKPNKSSEAHYKRLVEELKSTINGVRNRLKLRNEKPNLMLHGLRRGMVDEGSLYKLAFGEDQPLIFEQPEIINRIDMAFAVLIDESGSMGDDRSGKARVHIARDVAIVLAESLKDMEGIELSVLGHTAQGERHHGRSDGCCVHHYYTPENRNLVALAESTYFCQNLDGYAMLETTRRMLKWYPNIPIKTIFVVSDGLPNGHRYGDRSARQHMKRVCSASRRAGVELFGIGIDEAYSDDHGEEMYGKDNFVVLKDASESMSLLCNFVVNAVRRTCVLDVQ